MNWLCQRCGLAIPDPSDAMIMRQPGSPNPDFIWCYPCTMRDDDPEFYDDPDAVLFWDGD